MNCINFLKGLYQALCFRLTPALVKQYYAAQNEVDLKVLEPKENFEWKERLAGKTEIERIEMFNQAMRDANLDWTGFANKCEISLATLFNIVSGHCTTNRKRYQEIFSFMAGYKPAKESCVYENADIEQRINQIKAIYAKLINALEQELKSEFEGRRRNYKKFYDMKAKYEPHDLYYLANPN